jgi:hypothetical protein
MQAVAAEPAYHPPTIVDEAGRSCFDVMNQIGQRDVRSLADEDVKMIRHVVDGDKLLTPSGDDAGEVFLQFIIVFSPDQVLPALYSENNMDVNLCVGVGHDMPLRWSLSQFFLR